MIEHLGNAIGHFVGIAATLDWLQWLLLAFIAFVAFVLLRCQMANDAFDLRHLIVDTESGKVDRFAFAYLVGLVLVSWAFLYYVVAGKMTELFLLCCIVYWGAPKSIVEFLNARKGP